MCARVAPKLHSCTTARHLLPYLFGEHRLLVRRRRHGVVYHMRAAKHPVLAAQRQPVAAQNLRHSPAGKRAQLYEVRLRVARCSSRPGRSSGCLPTAWGLAGLQNRKCFFQGAKILEPTTGRARPTTDRSAGLIRDSSTAIWQTFFSTRQVWSSLCSPLSPATTISLLLSADANSPPRRTRLDGLSFGPALRRQVAGRMTPWCHGQRRAETRRRRGAHRAQRDGRRGARSQR